MASSNQTTCTPLRTTLRERLARALPKDSQYTLYHVSSPPTRCPAIFSAPPDSKPPRTYCESHFCSIAIEPLKNEKKLFVFAIEVLVYTTASLTTLFVSKADSTGYLHFLDLPKGTTSPLKTISTTFISYLVENRRRPGIRLVVSLFARAQDQYLFPGSIENQRKHVLSDRGLVKWWCQVLDPIARKHPAEGIPQDQRDDRLENESATTQGYVVVPGFDTHETSAFFPRSVGADKPDQRKWINSHPLREISNNANGPPRCLIPRFPDDPKARFLDELDDEIPEVSSSQTSDSPSKRGKSGQWRSVRTLEQFWETMAFRQECSSGRLVGFIWVVFTPENLTDEGQGAATESSQLSNISFETTDVKDGKILPTPSDSQSTPMLPRTPPRPQTSPRTIVVPMSPGGSSPQSRPTNTQLPSSQSSHASQKSSSSAKQRKLTGPIIPREPRIKASKSFKTHTQPAHSRYYSWPTTNRGQIVLDETAYKRVNDLLLVLDFSEQEIAQNSTRRWVDEVGVAAGITQAWGEVVIGEKEMVHAEKLVPPVTSTLNTGLIKRKRKGDTGDGGVVATSQDNGGNMLASTLVRKKPKANAHHTR